MFVTFVSVHADHDESEHGHVHRQARHEGAELTNYCSSSLKCSLPSYQQAETGIKFRDKRINISLQRNAGRVHLWSRMAWNWKGMANRPMMTSARARLAMYMLVTVLILLKMMM